MIDYQANNDPSYLSLACSLSEIEAIDCMQELRSTLA